MPEANASELQDIQSTVLNTVVSMLAFWDRNLRCAYANSAYEQSFERDFSLVGKTLDELLGPTLFALNKPYIDAALSGNEQVFERLIHPLNGALRPALARYIPSFVDGEIVGFVSELTDVSLLHETQQALQQQVADRDRAVALLRKSEMALEQAQQLGGIGSWEWEVETDITTWSKQLYQILGRDSARLPPTYAEHCNLYTPDSWQKLQQAVSKTLLTGEPYVLELEYIRSDGTIGWLEGRGAGERDQTGNIAFLHGTAQDVSDRKRSDLMLEVERQLAEVLSELEAERKRSGELELALARARKTEALGILSAGVAHDFNNVLSVVSGALHLVQKSAQDPRSRDFAERGLRGIDRATQLVRQLMNFARVRPPGFLRIDLASHLIECKELLAMSLGPGIQLHIAAQPCGFVEVDPSQLEVALINLLVNARDAMPHGGHVTIYTEHRNTTVGLEASATGWATIAVRDSGSGMSPEVLRRVREPFFTTKGTVGGTGLGLSMVNDFAHLSNGHLEIDSTPNKGTVVAISLPCVEAGANVIQQGPVETVLGAPDKGIVILVVDDDEMVLPMVSGYLHELGYVALEAASASMALGFVRSSAPIQLVISDISMYNFDGLQLAARLKIIRPSLPVLLMTGDASRNALDDGKVLVKPFTLIELARKVRTMLAPKPVLATRLAGRIRHPAVMKLYESWLSLRVGDGLPSVATLSPQNFAARDNLFIAEIVAAMPFTAKRIFVGQALAARLPKHSEGLLVAAEDDNAFAKMETAYRRCMRLKEPSHEYARIQLNEGDIVEFERLLLPCEEQDGSKHYLVGIVYFTNLHVEQIPDTNE